MALFGRKKTTIGLDIGSGLIKVAVIDHGRGEPELVKVAIMPLLADAIVEGEVMDPGIVDRRDSQRARAGRRQDASEVVTAVGGRDVIIKKIQIERVKEQQARELMRWEAEQHVPFDMESVELDFQILDPDGDGMEMSVLLVAAKRDLIESKMRLLTDAGLEPDASSTSTPSRCITRSRSTTRMRCAASSALINIGHEVTNINILDDGVPILTRDITVGTRRFREDLQRERGLGAERGRAAAPGLRSLAASRRGDREPRRGDRRRHRARRRVPRVVVALRRRRCARSTRAAAAPACPGLAEALADRLRVPVAAGEPAREPHGPRRRARRPRDRRSRTAADAPDRARAAQGRLSPSRDRTPMIEINLLPGAARKSKARGAGFSLLGVIGDRPESRVKDPFMLAAVVSVVVAVGAVGMLHMTQTARADELDGRASSSAVQDSDALRRRAARARVAPRRKRDSVLRQLDDHQAPSTTTASSGRTSWTR